MGKRKRSNPPKFATRGDWHTHYTVLFDDLLESPAFTKLSAHAKVAYIILLQEYKGAYTGNSVICPYSTFEAKGMRANTLSRALLQLETYGFVEIEHGGLEHKPNVYKFSEKWKESYDPDTMAKFEETFKELINRKKIAKEAKEDAA